MDDARGKATKFILDMLNIGGNSRGVDVQASDTGAVSSSRDADDNISEISASLSSSTASPLRKSAMTASEMSMSEGEIPILDGSTPRISLHSIKQSIQLGGDNGSVSVYGNQVEVVTSQGTPSLNSTTASNKIKINPMVNYDWDLKYYRGSLIALGNTFIAYTLKGRSGYVVRLLNPETATRALIKGFIGLVTDLAFAHSKSNTLAGVDEGGNLYVWDIKEEDSKIEYNIKLRVNRSPTPISEYHRVIWAPYLIEEDVDTADDEDRPLAITHHNQAEVVDIPMVLARCGCNEVTVDMLKEGEGFTAITDGHTKPITDGSLSPDNAVLATGSEDGYVKFWQVSEMMPDTTPSCLHEFQPHDGSPVSSLTFCDNHTVQEKDVPMWRFMITGAEYNREIKIWCTVTWTCIQTLRFTSPTADIANVLGESYFKACLDATARYLVLSDIGRKVLYILLVHQDREEGRAHITSITDFQLTQPLLSFIVTKAKLFKLKRTEHGDQENGDGGQMNGDDVHDEGMEELLDESELEFTEKRKHLLVQLRLYSIHTKSLQELLVHFQPEPSVPPPTPSNMSSIATTVGTGVRDALSDLSGMETGTEASTDVDTDQMSDPGAPATPGTPGTPGTPTQSSRPKLITPDAFTKTSSSRPESLSSSVTMVSTLGSSKNDSKDFNSKDFDDLFGSVASSTLSDTTVKSSVAESLHDTPRSSFREMHVLTPTSLPLPQTPAVERDERPNLSPTSLPIPNTPLLSGAPDASAVPKPMFKPFEGLMRRSMQDELKMMNENRKDATDGLDLFSPVSSSAPSATPDASIQSNGAIEGEMALGAGNAPTDLDDLFDSVISSPSPAAAGKSIAPESNVDEVDAVKVETEGHGASCVEEEKQTGSPASVRKEPIPTKEVPRTDSSESEASEQDRKSDGVRGRTESEGSDAEGAAEAWSTPAGQAQLISKLQRTHVRPTLAASPMTARVDIPPEASGAANLQDSSINQLLSLMQTQQQELAALRVQLQESQKTQETLRQLQGKVCRLEEAVQHQLEGASGLEDAVTNRLQSALAQHSMEENQRLEKALRERNSHDKKRQEQLTSTLSQAVTNAITGKLEKTIKQEMKGNVVSTVQKVLTPVQEQLNTTMAQKLTAADAVLKDSVSKMLKNKSVIDAIGSSAAVGLQGPIQASYRDAFQSTILPAFERSCQSMFQQINSAFQQGTQQYLERVTTSLENKRRDEKDARDPVVQQLQSQVQAFQAESNRLRSSVTSDMEMMLQKQLATSLHSLREELLAKLETQVSTSLQETVQAEIRVGLQEIRQQYGSSQETPVAEMGTRHDYEQIQRRITDFLREGEVAMAFQEALTAADLSLVMMVCESVDVSELFSQNAVPLSQPVLLSLIQQLSVDLLTNTELKHRYLEEAVMSLDTSNEVTNEHMPSVLQGLCEQLRSAISQCSGPTQKNLRVLLMAAQSLLR